MTAILTLPILGTVRITFCPCMQTPTFSLTALPYTLSSLIASCKNSQMAFRTSPAISRIRAWLLLMLCSSLAALCRVDLGALASRDARAFRPVASRVSPGGFESCAPRGRRVCQSACRHALFPGRSLMRTSRAVLYSPPVKTSFRSQHRKAYLGLPVAGRLGWRPCGGAPAHL